MPSYHQYWAYRLDARGIPDLARRDRLRDEMRSLRDQRFGGDNWLRGVLGAIGSSEPELEIDLLVYEPESLNWSLWSLRHEKLNVDYVEFKDGSRDVTIQESWYRSKITLPEQKLNEIRARVAELAAEEVDDFDEGLSFPYTWNSEDQLRQAAKLIRNFVPNDFVALAFVGAPGKQGGLRLVRMTPSDANVCRLEPVVSNSELSQTLMRLWYEGDLELGMEGVDELAVPSKDRPLVSGHFKARIAAVDKLARARSPQNLPELITALRDPSNAGEEWSDVRCALYHAITWFDVPDVWDAVLNGLKTEDPRTRSTIEYLLWRLDGLAKERSLDLAEARAARSWKGSGQAGV